MVSTWKTTWSSWKPKKKTAAWPIGVGCRGQRLRQDGLGGSEIATDKGTGLGDRRRSTASDRGREKSKMGIGCGRRLSWFSVRTATYHCRDGERARHWLPLVRCASLRASGMRAGCVQSAFASAVAGSLIFSCRHDQFFGGVPVVVRGTDSLCCCLQLF